jgi:hypothetical protein
MPLDYMLRVMRRRPRRLCIHDNHFNRRPSLPENGLESLADVFLSIEARYQN